MAPLRLLQTPRYIASFALDGSLVFAVLYMLAAANLSLSVAAVTEPLSPLAVGGAALSFCAGIHLLGRAALPRRRTVRQEIVLVTVTSLALGGMAFGAMWALYGTPRRHLAVLMLESAVAIPLSLALWRTLAQRWRVLEYRQERILIIGSGETARKVGRWIAEYHPNRYAVVGFADESEERMGEILAMGARIVTGYRHVPEFCRHRVDRIIVALDEKRGKLPIKSLVAARLQGLAIEEATSFFERSSGRISVETLLPSWLIYSDGFKTSRWRTFCKRAIDLTLSSILLVLTLPLMAIAALAVRLESAGPALYRQRRMGLDGREFDVLKFRSMYRDAESRSGPAWATEDDPRITRVGRILRKLRVDELPQLLNVLRGEMSFVGPRPERKHFVRQLEDRIPFYALRVTVRPGLTGWAQVRYRYGSTIEDAVEKLKYDLFYIKNSSALFDLWIVMKTLRVVLTGSGAR